jgi:hypothetical protein
MIVVFNYVTHCIIIDRIHQLLLVMLVCTLWRGPILSSPDVKMSRWIHVGAVDICYGCRTGCMIITQWEASALPTKVRYTC